MNTKAMYAISYGLFVVTARRGDFDNGCITNTVAQVTSAPNRISVAVNKANYTCGMIQESGIFTASVISEAAPFSLFQRFGFQSGKDAGVYKFDGFGKVKRAENGTLIVTEGTNAWISAKVEREIDLGSHILFIAAVTDMDVLSDVPSATYGYYQSNIKPKPEPKPEKNGATPEGKTIWRCTICGYEYIGDELPADFICPVCKHPASDFEKVTV